MNLAIPSPSWRIIGFCLVFVLAAIQSPRMVAAEPSDEKGATMFTEWKSDNDDRFAWDGAFYSFVNPQGQGIKLWVPPGEKPIRGVILYGNPGGGLGGDTREKSRQRDVVEFAARHHFGVGGVTGFSGGDTYENLGKIVLEAFRQWGRHGVHPELEQVPFIFSGSSNAGVFSFAMMMVAPERTICITPNVGPSYAGKIDDTTRGVPAWMHIGTNDPLFAHGFEDTDALFLEHGHKGALWTWEAEMKGHENGASDHVDLAFWEAVIPLRLPSLEGDVQRNAPVPLKPMDPSKGWYADFRTWDYDVARVSPASDYEPDPAIRKFYGWLPDENTARLYQSAASRTRQFEISFIENRMVEGGSKSGVLLSSSGSQLLAPGETVSLRVELKPLVRGIETITFYDRSRKIGEINARETLDFTFTVEDQPVYAIHARAVQAGRRGRSVEVLSNPLQVVVRQPELSKAIDAQWDQISWLKTFEARTVEARERRELLRSAGAPDPRASILSHPISLAQTDTFKRDGMISSFWTDVATSPAGVIGDSSRSRGREGNVKVQVHSAYADPGLYLLFRIDDPGDGDERGGRVDFHIASVGLPEVTESTSSLDIFASPMRDSLLRNALQIAFDTAGPDEVNVNFWQPWDIGNVKLTADNHYGNTGLTFDRVINSDGTIDVELFLPWSMVGNPGLRGQPEAGSSLTTVIGYDTADRSAGYRWPYGKDPWAVSNTQNPDTPVFGEIRLQP